MDVNALPCGYILHGRAYEYEIQDILGQGSFGITYLAKVKLSGSLGSIDSSIQVAVKEFFMKDFNGRVEASVTSGSSKGGLYDDYKKKFAREARNLSHLQHPNIIKVLESFEANNTVYYAMEYIDGGSLNDLIEKRNGLSVAECLEYVGQIGSALSYMHTNKVLHLDLKPSNIMLRRSGEAVLIDFGLSKQYDENGEPESSTTIGGGTPGYAPIEQAHYREGKSFPVTMDVYALGATMFKMLTGVRPPESSDILNDGFPAFELQKRGIDDNIVYVVSKAMSPIKNGRYVDVQSFVSELCAGGVGVVDDEATIVDKGCGPQAVSVKSDVENSVKAQFTSANKKKYGLVRLVRLVIFVVILVGCLCIDRINHESKNRIVAERETLSAESQTDSQRIIDMFEMVYVAGGTFDMGATDVDSSDKPIHSVTLSSYYIGKYEVTQKQWIEIMGTNPSKFEGDNLPVEMVSWNDVQEFIKKLNAKTGKNYRLPTEAEWEYAARGGNKSRHYKYSGGDDIDKVAWYSGNSAGTTHPVGMKLPNELGIYDMSGNVFEWCYDQYGDYSSVSQTNPKGPSYGGYRVIRGGNWYSDVLFSIVSTRFCNSPEVRFRTYGFRLAMDAYK